MHIAWSFLYGVLKKYTATNLSVSRCVTLPPFSLFTRQVLPPGNATAVNQKDMNRFFFDNWQSSARIALMTVLAYVVLIGILRASGKRTLAKMNAFDFIITIALGSAFATVCLDKKIALFDGALVFLLLVGLQYIISWLSVRSPFVRRLVTSRPTLLVYQGEILHAALKKERVSIDELHAAIRSSSTSDIESIAAVVFETTGDITVIEKLQEPNAALLKGVARK